MASIAKSSGGSVRVFFYDKAGRRKAVHLGRVSDDIAEGVCRRIERILNAQIHGEEPSRNDSEWLAKSGLRKKFVAVGLVEPLLSDAKAEIPTLEAFIRMLHRTQSFQGKAGERYSLDASTKEPPGLDAERYPAGQDNGGTRQGLPRIASSQGNENFHHIEANRVLSAIPSRR
jgi:hypothetical protein